MRVLLLPTAVLAAAGSLDAQALQESFRTSVTGSFPPAGWSESNTGTGKPWEDAAGQWGWGTLALDAAAHDYHALTSANCDDLLTAPTLDLTGYADPQLTFDRELRYSQWMAHHPSSLGNGVSEVELSTDGGVTWSAVWSEGMTADGFYPGEVVDLTAVAANRPSVTLRFRYFGNDAHAWAVDEVWVERAVPTGPSLQVVGPCPGQVSLVATNCSPYGTIVFAYSTAPGSFTVPGGGCAGLTIPMANPVQLGSVFADSAGVATFAGNAPAAACGLVTVVAVDVSACERSYVVTL